MAFTSDQLSQFIESVKQKGKYYVENDDFKHQLSDWENYLSGNSNVLPTAVQNYYGWYFSDVFGLLSPAGRWDEADYRLIKLTLQPQYWVQSSFEYYFFTNWLTSQVKDEKDRDTFGLVITDLKKLGITEKDIQNVLMTRLMNEMSNWNENKMTSIGKYMLAWLAKDELNIVRTVIAQNQEYYFLHFALRFSIKTVDNHLDYLLNLKNNYYNRKELNTSTVNLLLQTDAKKYEPEISKSFEKIEDPKNLHDVLQSLLKYFPEKYKPATITKGYQYLELIKQEVATQKYFYESWSYNQELKTSTPISTVVVEQLLQNDPENAKKYLLEYLSQMPFTQSQTLEVLSQQLKADSVPYLMAALNADARKSGSSFFRVLFEMLGKYDFSLYEDKIWALTKSKSKQIRELVAVTLAKLGEKAVPQASELLKAKTADQRQTAALLLTLINTDETKQILTQALNEEKSDDARDIMLQPLVESLYQTMDETAIAGLVEGAKKRGKLEKPIEKWLEEDKLPALYFQSGKKLDSETVRFLLYRMNRTKEMRPDVEAKPILQLIDRERSGDFAKKIFKLYLDNGADAKQKYCLALAGLLGDDEVIDSLRASVNRWADSTIKYVETAGKWEQTGEGARIKMAEYAVGALALIGTNKALRTVEYFSRKYKNKKRNVGEAAFKALIVAAEELGITMYELADSIIPDFGFEGLYKTFDANGEEYRAFIGNDFKLQFLNEDNKIIKSAPKGISAELKEEFKEIGKEVRDIVRSQSDRMEQYMVIQRKWNFEDWDKFFRNNPIMFVYAMRIVWGVFDENGALAQTFMCLEDTTLLNLEDEEIEISENQFVGMVHPLAVSEEVRQAWIGKFFELDLQPAFPQFTRETVTMEEKDKPLKISETFNGKKVDGFAFIGQMEKRGWTRGSVVDGGMVSGYFKRFAESGIDAFIETDMIFMGYYEDGDASMGRLFFVKTGSVAIGNYTYNEPRDDKDERLISFADLPPIIYSEVAGDLKSLIKEEVIENKT
ncbi:MAG: DUF4132 domain-containing protein [Verrucomicrobia bacterium]|nr:DUF4132 domain-containing protein [Cytophagales bacterium]